MSDGRVTIADIARLAEVKLSAVSNWRRRYKTFPRPERRNGQELFMAADIAAWLDDRKIARNDIKDTELPGMTYGARFRNNLGLVPKRDADQMGRLWRELSRFRGAEDIATYADLALGLLYLSVREHDRWVELATAGGWKKVKLMELAILDHAPVSVQLHRAWRSVLVESPDGKRLGEIIRVVDRIRRNVNTEGRPDQQRVAEVFEYLLNRFAAAEGKRGAVVVTPPSVTRVLVELVALRSGESILDPCSESGGFLLEAARYVEAHGGILSNVSFNGQAMLERSWSSAQMNLDLHGVSADLAARPGIALHDDLHAGKRFDAIVANPPFNMSGWDSSHARDRRWPFGVPPKNNANFAWLQHIWSSLAEGGRAAIVMPNGTLSSEQAGEGRIRAAMVEDGAVEALIALPPQLFVTTAIPVTVWLLRRTRVARPGEILFIDARTLGSMISRTQRDLFASDIRRIRETVFGWRDCRTQPRYEDVQGFSASVPLQEIRKYDYQLAPGRYVGTAISANTSADSVVGLQRELDYLHMRAAEIDAAAERHLNRMARWIP